MNYAGFALFASLFASAAIAAPQTDLSHLLAASATPRADSVRIDVASPEGWTCTGQLDVSSGSARRGGRGSGGTGRSTARPTPVRMSCSDGTTAQAQVTQDTARHEYRIAFSHRTHGRASLRAREE